jgi:hypothetical protein
MEEVLVLSRGTVWATAKPVAEVLVGLMAMQGIFYYLWVPLDWQSLLLVGLILSIAQVIRATRGRRRVAPANLA